MSDAFLCPGQALCGSFIMRKRTASVSARTPFSGKFNMPKAYVYYMSQPTTALGVARPFHSLPWIVDHPVPRFGRVTARAWRSINTLALFRAERLVHKRRSLGMVRMDTKTAHYLAFVEYYVSISSYPANNAIV